MDQFSLIEGAPFASAVFVGRNTVFAVSVENGSVWGWGSNRYGQIMPSAFNGPIPITNLNFKLDTDEKLFPSSYITLLQTSRSSLGSIFKSQLKQS